MTNEPKVTVTVQLTNCITFFNVEMSALITLVKISARSRRDWRDLGEISVILGENFSGKKISARSRRDRVDLAEVGEISAR